MRRADALADPGASTAREQTMTARYELSGIWLSGPAYKVGLMLSLLGERFDYVHVNLRAGEHKTPAFLAKQRFGQVPLLVDRQKGLNLCQSASILEYLAAEHGRFGGAGEAERIEAREWLFWAFDRLAIHIYRARGVRLGLRSLNQPVVELHHTEGNAALKVLDDHLAGREWIVGKGPTIADVDCWGVIAYAGQGGFDLARYPNVSAWIGRLKALPGYGDPEAVMPKESRTAA
jgi:glutathione S-transferase